MTTQEQLTSKFQDFIEKDDSPYYFYIHDTEGVFTYISPHMTELLGFSIDEFKSFYLNHATGNPINKEMIRYTQQCLKGNIQEPYKVEVYDKDYKTHTLCVSERPVYEGEKIVGIEGVAKVLN